MEFEWDETKSERNMRERGMSFDMAVHALKQILDNKEDARRKYGETRMIAKCLYEERIVIVIYTMRLPDAFR